MYFILLILITLVSSFFLVKLLKRGDGYKNLPKGSLGFPLIGETFSFLQAQMKDKGDDWVQKRVIKYGPVFKTSLMGSPAVIILGQAGNKFILGSAEDVLAAKQPKTLSAIAGEYTLSTLTGSRYKLIKGAMVSFLKPESIQNYIKQMDDLVTTTLLKETQQNDTIQTVIFMKKLTFNIAFKILFGIRDEFTRDAFFSDFSIAFKAVWSLPLNLPGTIFWRGKRARTRIISRILPIMKRMKENLLAGNSSPTSDIISALLKLQEENGEIINEQVILDNFVILTMASHDTSAILMSMMVWKLSRDPEIYKKILKEQMEIMKDREGREEKNITWGDIQKMKFTWRVAQELMRIIPPVFATSRRTLKDTNFNGYHIPKGWQVFSVAHGTHMDKEIFENPMEFDPSRFENSSSSSSSNPIPPYTYIPFGAGLHSCIGNEFARVETLITIHRLITMYEWSQLYPHESITRNPMPYPSMGLPIIIKPLLLSN